MLYILWASTPTQAIANYNTISYTTDTKVGTTLAVKDLGMTSSAQTLVLGLGSIPAIKKAMDAVETDDYETAKASLLGFTLNAPHNLRRSNQTLTELKALITQPHDMEEALSRFDIHYTMDPLCIRLWALEAHYHIELIDKQ